MADEIDNRVLALYRVLYGDKGQKAMDTVILLSPDELLPNARAKYDAALKEHHVDSIPIILDRNKKETDTDVDVVATRT